MAYMVYQQYTTAVLEAYAGHAAVGEHLESARLFREWLQSLEIDTEVKDVLVEQALTLEQAFERLVTRQTG